MASWARSPRQSGYAGESGRATAAAVLLVLAALAYIAATLLTEADFTGDAPEYARSSAASLFGVNCQFLEAGHLAWRPLGRWMLELFVTPRGDETFWLLSVDAVQQLSRAAWFGGLIGVLAAAAWLHRSTRSFAAAAFGVASLIACKAYLNYSQVGSPYIPGLAALFVGLWLAALEPRRAAAVVACDIASGVCMAASALFWGTYVLALPGIVLAPLVLEGDRRAEFRRVLRRGTAGVIALLAVYVLAARAMGFHSSADYRAWVAAASHGVSIGGVPRAVLGFARSFMDLGDYGRLVKRYLAHDAFNPAATSQLLSVHLLKLAAFYVTMLGFGAAAMLRPGGRRTLAAGALMALPTFLFALTWQGGDLERYLPAMPALILVAAAAFQGAAGRAALRSAMVAAVVVLAGSNLVAMSDGAAHLKASAAGARLAGSEAVPIDHALFVVSHWQDDLMVYNHERPFDDLNLAGLSVYPLVTPGAANVPMWKRLAAAWMLIAWSEGDRVLVSSRIFAPRPDVSWTWTDADDTRVTWGDLSAFFRITDFALVPAAGGEFRELVPTERNRRLLERIVFAPDPVTRTPPDPAGGVSGFLASTGACRIEGNSRRGVGSSRSPRTTLLARPFP